MYSWNSEIGINHTALHYENHMHWLLTTKKKGAHRQMMETSIPTCRHFQQKGTSGGIDISHQQWQWRAQTVWTLHLLLHESEVNGHIGNLLPRSQANLTVLTKRNNQLTIMSRSWRRSTSGGIWPHRTGITESFSHTQGMIDLNSSTYRSLQISNAPLHRHTMHHREANKSNKFTATGNCHLQLTQFNKIGGMVNGLRKRSQISQMKVDLG